ncbi:MFS general substrate transporter [Rhodofomes roseus]|uniref:MFS general substrate transporter n=1 Tax=Rhodofomes roseus TaxID=34475 RepID=A0ABQ8KKH9_9APHY|nr:MFS general substrate transporter [Rhodofomes roseus]KAH9838659.1 MFS general substrate transporter [Rhodofomes roseus]
MTSRALLTTSSDRSQGEQSHSGGDERAPLLSGSRARPAKKWYRARPLWLVPFSITASIVRGMTIGPRVEVFTQLSCNAIYGHHSYNHTSENTNTILPTIYSRDPTHIESFIFALDGMSLASSILTHHRPITFVTQPDDDEDDDERDPRTLPSKRCSQDAAVQKGAARLQTIMTFTAGVLSALTTGWWGHFGEMRGRTKVLSAATLGLFLTDLTFILVSTPHSIFAAHGHKLLVISPMVEGLLGGWQTLMAAVNAYVSDCTSDGSRAHIFSRFLGISFFGFALGPAVGAYFIRHPFVVGPLPSPSAHGTTQNVTTVFYIAALCSLINLMLALFVFPEPTKKAKISAETQALPEGEGSTPLSPGKQGHMAGFLGPFKLVAPRVVQNPDGTSRKDWRITLIATSLLVYALSTGIFQIKYLYAVHVYGWDAEQLSYYISAMGGCRTLYLLVLMPVAIYFFKPKPKVSPQASAAPTVKGKKPPQTPAQIAAEMRFDFGLLRTSLVIDLMSHVLVSLSSPDSSSTAFTMFTSLSSFGAGVDPALQSLALCIMQANGEDNRGQLFGLFAMLRTIGQMIIGPLIFGLIYAETVATFPKAIFVAAGSFAFAAFIFLSLIRPDAGIKVRRRVARRVDEGEMERGRSRVSKDISKSGTRVAVVSIGGTPSSQGTASGSMTH